MKGLRLRAAACWSGQFWARQTSALARHQAASEAPVPQKVPGPWFSGGRERRERPGELLPVAVDGSDLDGLTV